MTCIVGLEHEGKVYMGGDSCASSNDAYVTFCENKVFEVKTRDDKFLIGNTGYLRGQDILTYQFNPVRADENDSDDKFMRTRVVDATRKAFTENGMSTKINEQESYHGEFLIGYKGCLYCMGCDYSVLNCHDGYAIGSGGEVALGSLWTTKDWKDPEKRIRTALEAAEAVISSVRSPMYIKSL